MNEVPCTECGTFKEVTALINQISIQAEGRVKTMKVDYQDIVSKVIDKLSVLDDLFAFYWIAHDKVGFQDKSIEGLSFIISDCIADLKEAAK